MDSNLNKLVCEEQDLLDDDVLDIEVGDNPFSMPTNVDDLLDTEVGTGVGGQQLQSQPVKERYDGEQSHPESDSIGNPKDQKEASMSASKAANRLAS